MNDEKLIKLVRNSPVLYDLSHSKYMNTEFKNHIWNKIGAEMGTTGPLCKTRWAHIRDNFRKHLKKNKTVSGQEPKNYKYAEQLTFLRKFFDERETSTNIIHEVTNLDFTCDDDIVESASHRNEGNIQEYTIEVTSPVIVKSRGHTSSKSRQTDSIQCPIPRKKAEQSIPNAPSLKTAATAVMEYLVKKHGSMGSCSPPSQHPVDAFLKGIAPALKELCPENWHYAKADIFAAVQKYEFRMLMDQQRTAESSRLSTCSTPTYLEQPCPPGSYNYNSTELK